MLPEPQAKSVPQLRVRAVNDRPVQPAGDFVLYWMTTARRTTFSFGLQRAVEWARRLDRPLVVLEALRAGYPWASDRLHRFLLDGMAENRRRGILLVFKGDEVEDYSLYDPDTVRRFLAAIHVPLFVWTLGKPVPGSLATAWGPSEQVDRVMNLYRASYHVRDELRAQRVVLVEGHHLPQSIALGPAAKGVELAGGAAPGH